MSMASLTPQMSPTQKKTLYVVAFDVSASMRAPLKFRSYLRNAKECFDKLEPKRVKTVFDVICRLAEDSIDAAKERDMYAAILCFGLRHVETCDLLALLEHRTKMLELVDHTRGQVATGMQYEQAKGLLTKNGIVSVDKFLVEISSEDLPSNFQHLYKVYGHRPLINLLANAGAPYCEEYVEKHLTAESAGKYFMFFAVPDRAEDLDVMIISLPDACKEKSAKLMPKAARAGAGLGGLMGSMLAEKMDNAEESAVEKATRFADNLIAGQEDALAILKRFSTAKPRPLSSVVQLIKRLQLILNENGENEVVTDENKTSLEDAPTTAINWERLLDEIEFHLYGWTPMCQALRSIWPLFRDQEYSSRVLMLISDGDATDGDPRPIAQALRNAGGTIFTCLLTAAAIKEPRQLYSPNKFNRRWSAMFNMASIVSCDSKPVQALRRRGWKVPASGKCKLFIKANSPIIIDEFTSASRELGTNSDTIAEIIGQISLDDNIQRSNNAATATNQGSRRICWAHATGTVIHLALTRIVGRKVPEFIKIRSQLLTYFGDNDNGQHVGAVLEKICPMYGLRYKECSEEGARAAIHMRRPVIATFWLDGNHWDKFTTFYNSGPTRTLSARHMSAPIGGRGEGGHAVVLVRCDETSLTFMNSWGSNFANNGFFTVDRPSTLEISGGPLMRFYDVYWTINDLSEEEKRSWKHHEIETVHEVIGALPESFHNLPIVCPHCGRRVSANNYDGAWYEARCRACHQTFEPTVWDLLQSLYADQYIPPNPT